MNGGPGFFGVKFGLKFGKKEVKLTSLEAPMPIIKHSWPEPRQGHLAVGILHVWLNLNKGISSYDQIVGSHH